MNKVEGLHHLAICTANMKEQIEFFTDKLGMELQALYWMHGVENTWHGFLRLNDESSIAFVCNPDIEKIPVELGQSHAGNPGANSARGTMQHLAFKVKNHHELLAMRDRLRSKGVPVMGPVEHGMCCSMYFAGPENLALELSYSNEPIDHKAWIDPEVVALAGISAEELASFTAPASFDDQAGQVSQPNVAESPGPHMANYPEGVYQQIMNAPDDALLNSLMSDPPVDVNAG
ncbi:MAG: catechol 2,3-dioxygenase-like lactoylglutathione lyase family enzyme [Limisphaerales bacterium]|jgi:catechol 2,3-dioxygenase-like lactoylglutathione lyase family enzyme